MSASTKKKKKNKGTPTTKTYPTDAGSTRREIALSDSDWRWATWRQLPSSPLPKTRLPFDLASCLTRLSTKVRPGRFNLDWDFSRAELSPSMSQEEARFWLECMLTIDARVAPKQKAAQLAKKKKLGPLILGAVRKALRKMNRDPVGPELAIVLAAYLPAVEAADLILDGKPDSLGHNGGGNFIQSFKDHVVPRLTDREKAKIRRELAPMLSPQSFPTDYYDAPAGEFLLAALVGGPALGKKLEAVVESWPDDRYVKEDWHDAYHVPQLIIFGLESAELVNKHMRRLNLRLHEPHYMRAWLAHTEYSGLDWAAKTVVETKNKDNAAKLAEVLALVHAPENTAPMLEIATRSKAPKIGADWIDQNVAHAVPGLVELAAGASGRTLADAATSWLSDLKRAGHADLIDRVIGKGKNTSKKGAGATQKLAALEAKETKLVAMTSVPAWLTRALAQANSKTKSKLKEVFWLNTGRLPSLEVDSGKKLDPEHVKTLVAALAASPPPVDEPETNALVAAIREHAPEASRDAFAWRIFEEWMTAGAPAKERWALYALGHLGGDAAALKLAPMIRAWPGESQHDRAVRALDVLGAIGTDMALVQLSGIAQKVKFQALKRRAGEAMERIAKSRKMTRDELEDRIVPDGGFGEDGKRVLSFGGSASRSFEVVLGAQGTPMLKELHAEGGKKRADLPKPGKQDDPAAAARALEEWKTLKKGLREATKIQIERLEQAMVKGRSWSAKDFETLLLKHPLMSHLVRTLVWGAWVNGKLASTFRIAEDASAANEKDVSYKIPKAAAIRIVHPLELDEGVKTAWGNIFGDYEIIAPFAQLDRPVHSVLPAEKKLDDLNGRVKGQEWGVTAFIGKLRRRGWLHGAPQDGGYVGDHHKPFFSANVTAVIEHTGYPIGALEYADPQQIEHIYFLSGTNDGNDNPRYDPRKKKLKLASVDPKALSEVLYDLLS